LKGRDRRSHNDYLDSFVLDLIFKRVVAAASVGEKLAIEVFVIALNVGSEFLTFLNIKPVDIAVFLADGNDILVVLGLSMTHHHELCIHIYSRIIFNSIKYHLCYTSQVYCSPPGPTTATYSRFFTLFFSPTK